MKDKDKMTYGEAAEWLHCSVRTVRREIIRLEKKTNRQDLIERINCRVIRIPIETIKLLPKR